MKTIRTFLTLASAMVLASCSQDENVSDMVDGEIVTITVGMPENGKSSRVNYDESVEGNQLLSSLKWDKDDQIFVAGYNGEEYLGSKIFHYKGEGNTAQGTFTGMAFNGATHYKVYYKNAGLTLSEQGVPTFNYAGQTQTSSQTKPTAHLKDYLYLSTMDKITAEAFSQTFLLNMQNALLCYDIKNVKQDMGALTKIALTTNAGEQDEKTVELATSGEFSYPCQFYMSFDPAALSQTGGKKLSVSLYGDKVYRVSTLVASDKTYAANTRYAVNIDTKEAEGVLSAWENENGVPCPVLVLTEVQKEVGAEAANGLSFAFSVENVVAGVQPTAETLATWIKDVQVTVLEGGQTTVTYAVDANETTEVREGVITVNYEGAESVNYTVKQVSKALPTALALTEVQKEVGVEAVNGLSFAFSVKNVVAGVQPTAVTTAGWIKNVQVASFAAGNGSVTFDVDANEVSELREGVITVSYEGAESVNYTVKQAAMAPAQQTSATFNNTGVLVGMPAQQYAGVTYEALVNFSSFNDNNTVIGQEEVFLLRVGDSGKDNNQIHVCFDNLDAQGEAINKNGSLLSNTRLSANKWYHLAATIQPSGSGVEVALYINGVLEKSQVFADIHMPEVGGDGKALPTDNYHSATNNYDAKRGIFIGRLVNFKWGGDRAMNGMMREARVWSVARTADQIQNNMFSVDASSAGLEAYYKFDGSDVSGNTVTDASGKNHNGTVKAGNITSTEHAPIIL